MLKDEEKADQEQVRIAEAEKNRAEEAVKDAVNDVNSARKALAENSDKLAQWKKDHLVS